MDHVFVCAHDGHVVILDLRGDRYYTLDPHNAGAIWEDAPVVRDGTWVSSRGPQDLLEFVPAMVSLFAEHLPAAQRQEAPQEGRPWLRWALGGLAVAALGYGLKERKLVGA